MIGADVMLALPEILMVIAGMALLLLGTFLPANGTRPVTWIAILVLAAAFVIVAWETPARTTAFDGLFIADQFGRFMKLRPEVVRAAALELLEQWSQGAFEPTVGATFPLAEADAALRSVAERRSLGKVVLVP